MVNNLSTEIIGNQQLRPLNNTYYGYLYETTNTINGKKYVGVHKGSKLDPNYKGSGLLLRKAIEKYGKENFQTAVLQWCHTKEELFQLEKEYIDANRCVESTSYYNLMVGGYGGDNKTNMDANRHQKFIRNAKIAANNRKITKKMLEGYKKTAQSNRGRIVSEDTREKSRQSNIGQKRSSIAKQHMRENHADVNGVKNPFYGKHHTNETRQILSQKCVGCKGYIWITNKKDHEILITKEQLKDYPGYVRGRLRNRQKKVKFND